MSGMAMTTDAGHAHGQAGDPHTHAAAAATPQGAPVRAPRHNHSPLEAQRMLLTLVEFLIVILTLHLCWRVLAMLRERELPLAVLAFAPMPRPPRA